MNKIAQGAVAAGLGVALLLGGGATLAYWNDSETVSGATITAGSLDIAPSATAPTWTVTNGSVLNQPISAIGTFRMVPGDTVTYRASYTVAAVGDNLRVQASLGTASLTGDLADRLSATTTVAVGSGSATLGPVTVVNGDTLNVTVTITWPFGDSTSITPDNGAMNDAGSFEGFNVVVTQVAP